MTEKKTNRELAQTQLMRAGRSAGTASTRASIGIGHALLDLAEAVRETGALIAKALEPPEPVLLEVKPPDLEAVMANAHALLEMQAEYERLMPYVGKEVWWGGHLGILSAVSREDVDNAVCWASFVSRTAAVNDCVVRSTEINTARLRVEGPPHSRCGECNQTTGNYHLSNCSKNVPPPNGIMACAFPGCTDSRDARWHGHTQPL